MEICERIAPMNLSDENPARPPFDWTRISDDPNNEQAYALAGQELRRLRRLHTDTDVLGFVQRAVAGRRVLDVGVVSHSADYFDRPDWRHGLIRKTASYCLGIDILADLVEQLRERGFNVRVADATSDEDLGERFDVVFVGDVIEHVDNPAALLRYCGRHLAPGGRLLVSTPNPFSRKFVRQFLREGVVVVNLDHVAWITPTQAMEIARRIGLRLNAYHMPKAFSPGRLRWKRLTWRFSPAEYSFPDYVYEFGRLEDLPGVPASGT